MGIAYVEKNLSLILVGDGELYTLIGAMMSASHYDLKDLLVIVDRNYSITLDKTNMIKLENQRKKSGVGFNTDVVDGHDYKKIILN